MARLTIKSFCPSTMGRILIMSACSTLLMSCTTIASSVVEDLIQYGVNESPRNEALSINPKTNNKERTQLIKDGKCPVCKGMGRSADGKYVCKACNGTGQYNETKNEQ